jgi:CDP-glucose 4,6-dehydratase
MEKYKKIINFWRNKKVFITGHTGFKGSWMILMLNLFGAKIYGFSLKPYKKSLFNQANCSKLVKKNIYSDVNNEKKLSRSITKIKPDIIFHLAAQPLVSEGYKSPIKTFDTNINGTINVLNAIKKCKSLKSAVIVTTDKVYKVQNSKKHYSEDDELGGSDPYSASKVCAEIITNSYIQSYFKTTNLKNRVSSARSGNVIGGGDYAKNRLVPDIIYSINNNKKLKIRNPNHIRPWQHVIEPTFGYLKLAQLQFENKLQNVQATWNFGPNKRSFVKVINIINKIKKVKKLKTKIVNKRKFSETKVLKLNNYKAKKMLNWKPKWDLNKSLNNVIDWNNQYKKNKNAKQICEKQIINYLKR